MGEVMNTNDFGSGCLLNRHTKTSHLSRNPYSSTMIPKPSPPLHLSHCMHSIQRACGEKGNTLLSAKHGSVGALSHRPLVQQQLHEDELTPCSAFSFLPPKQVSPA